jgi:DNA-binding PadR family transcriptional regulator
MFGFHSRHDRHQGRGRHERHDEKRCEGMRGPFEAMRERVGRGGRPGPGGDEFGDGFRHGGRGGRGGRFFDHGDLKLVVLALIAGQPRHGYEIIKAIEDMAGGAYSPSPGVVYPTLTMLEDLGQVTVEAIAGNRKQYAITDVGRAYLAEHDAEVRVIFARIEASAQETRGPDHPSLIRAMGNLRLALRLRFTRGDFSPESIAAVAAALDEAASKIERT